MQDNHHLARETSFDWQSEPRLTEVIRCNSISSALTHLIIYMLVGMGQVWSGTDHGHPLAPWSLRAGCEHWLCGADGITTPVQCYLCLLPHLRTSSQHFHLSLARPLLQSVASKVSCGHTNQPEQRFFFQTHFSTQTPALEKNFSDLKSIRHGLNESR